MILTYAWTQRLLKAHNADTPHTPPSVNHIQALKTQPSRASVYEALAQEPML